ncbi:polysaccharide biosynthesis tyrosine autokinase [Rubripirellula reticaptiva]|uniref:non-specific protein-tyrosine kinase n=1 Tax=Rubripirellula reticaptiva TaxID=2528013 RepID=A0A5C6EI46_9BACT|nr:polysaccharide biosynthesis tyrosine autokinase [Rubripirellula reticaptiva]TWU48105.1 putative tyrosine-protein kinase in cps region [Rubripirellula reticaptiva]
MADANKSMGLSPNELDISGMIRRRWRLLVFGMVVGVGLSILYFKTAPRVYESSIEVLVGQRSSEMTNRGTISSTSGGTEGMGEDELATHMRLFVARKVLTEAIKLGSLDELDTFRKARENDQSLVDHILENIEVERGGEGAAADAMVLRVFYHASNPEESATVLAAVFQSYKRYIDSQDQDNSKLAVELIEAARETHEQELSDADAAYRDFVASVPVLLEGDKVRDIHKERLSDMETELNKVRSSLAENESRLQVILTEAEERGDELAGEMDQLALLSEKEVDRLKFFLDMTRGSSQSEKFQAEAPVRQEVAKAQYNRLLDLIQREKALSDTFGKGHPLVEATRQETEITRQFIAANAPETKARETKTMDAEEMLKTYVMLLRNDISELQKRKTILMEEAEREMLAAKEVEASFMESNSLKAKLARAQSRYDQVIVRLQELNLSRSYAGFSTDLLASAEVPRNAVWPKLPIVLAVGVGAGLALGLLLTLAAETFDSTFGSVTDLESTTKAAVIAHVPRLNLRTLRKAAIAGSQLDPSLLTYHTPRSAEAEIFRVGRTSLMIANRKDSVQTIMVTSPQPGDGKSTTISNLAISFAQAGKRVLLIDADMRRPVISKLFGIDDRKGLSDFLAGRVEFADGVVETEVQNLHIMPNGSNTSEPAELLESHRLMRLFQNACESYDLVMIDAPPVLAVADPAIIAPYVDSVLLTVRVTKNGRGTVEDAVRILNDIQITPAAVIVNGIDRNALKTYAYGGYGKGKYGGGYIGHYHADYAAKERSDVHRSDATRSEPTPKNGRPATFAAASADLGSSVRRQPAPITIPSGDAPPMADQSSKS